MTTSAGMRYFTVLSGPAPSHIPAFMTPIGSGRSDALDLVGRFPEVAELEDSVATFSQLFALRRLLQADDERGLVGLGEQRRFVVCEPSTLTYRNAVARSVSRRALLNLAPELFMGDGRSLVLPPAIEVAPSVLSQYNAHHHTRDLLFFFGLAVDLGFISGALAANFLAQPAFIAGATAGVFPAEWLVVALTQLEVVARAFNARFRVERGGYQSHATGFCCERLLGLLAQALLEDWPQPDRDFHRVLLIDDSEEVVSADCL